MKIHIFVKPSSKKGPLIDIDEKNQFIVHIREKAVDGKANNALIKALSIYFKVPKTSINITRGHHSRHKTIDIANDSKF